MSVTLEKLRALKRQAGATVATPAAHGVKPSAPAGGAAAGADGQAVTPCSSGNAAPAPLAAGGRVHASPHAASAEAAPSLLPHSDSVTGPSTNATAAAPGPQTAPHADRATGEPRAAASAPRIPAGPAAVNPALNSLRRLLGVRERRPSAPIVRGPLDRDLPGDEIAPGLRLIETRLAFASPSAALPLAFARRDDAVDPASLMFFDTETTGLAGGTGTRAFMIGAADWHAGGFRIRQLMITTMAAEDAMLREFASWLAPGTVLASYNGRSYDAPLLKTRYRLARLSDPLHGLDHLDLLHPTRRRYRGRWENCRLATIERELLRIVREDDLPGSQAPMAWLTYLRGGASTLLRRVAAHNHQDVVTLARLLLQLIEAQAADR
ncbi:ribonuclease H-like domain-containing protein [Lysobacter korlensis]|uniref:Ribonuclease H-like domain-containing protein n=1 Tax=Lysobacter korlensis TaxID=553636 RepID=A0ABV6RHE5_9GAMM